MHAHLYAQTHMHTHAHMCKPRFAYLKVSICALASPVTPCLLIFETTMATGTPLLVNIS